MSITPEERFATLVDAFLDNPVVTPPSDGMQPGRKKFGSSALKVQDKIFAMLSDGKLVVKLPKQRVNALITSGQGGPFDPRRDGRIMKEWIAIEPDSDEHWLALAREAMEFVSSTV